MRDEVIERARDGVRLIISVDTGIRAFAAAETARRTGVDLIVHDHHLPGTDGVPHALQWESKSKRLRLSLQAFVRAGVAFKLAQGLMQRRLDTKDQSRLLMSFMKVVASHHRHAVPCWRESRVREAGIAGAGRPVNVA